MKKLTLQIDLAVVAILLGVSLYLGIQGFRPIPPGSTFLKPTADPHRPFPRYEPLKRHLSGLDLAYYYQDPSWKLPRKAHHFQAQYVVAPTVLRFLYDFPSATTKLSGRPVMFDFTNQADLDMAVERYVASLQAENQAVETTVLRPGFAVLKRRETP